MIKHPTRTCRAVLTRLRRLGADLPGPDEQYRITNLRTGHLQRSAGAWSWELDYVPREGEGPRALQIGGYWPATVCAKVGAAFDGSSLDPSDGEVRKFQERTLRRK